VFEGSDGSGKTTLSKEFWQILKSRKVRARYFAFPGQANKTLGKHVHRVHHDPHSFDIEKIHPASLQIMHIAAHIDSIESEIVPAIRHGEWVVLDRYWWSTWAYGLASGVSRGALRLMIQLELYYWRGFRPTAVFLIERGR